MKNLRTIAAGLGLTIALLAGQPASAADGRPLDALPLDDVSSLTVTSRNFKAAAESWTATCERQDLIDQLIEVIRRAEPSEDHKCPDVAVITFHLAAGGKIELGILPGHAEHLYQFRVHRDRGYDIYQVERPLFLAALAAVGCPVKEPGFPR